MQATALVVVFTLLVCYALAQDSCATTPFDPACINYAPDQGVVANYTTNVCNAMPGMPGCYVNQLCKDSSYHLGSDKYCDPFSVYIDVCKSMGGMSDCSLYTGMCPNTSSVIKECYVPALTLPSGSTAKNLSLTMCGMMKMQACDDCNNNANCNYLKMYSDLCISMPGMSQCDAWKTMCADIPDWPLCSNTKSHKPIPVMRMFFHTGIVDYVLFESWVPNSDGAYAGTWFAVFFFTILYELVKLFRSRLEKKWTDKLDEEYVSINGTSKVAFLAGEAPFRFGVDFSRAIIHTIEVAWGFLVMLVVMTFNVGLCFAVLAGSFFGMLFFGSISKRLNVYLLYDKESKDM